MSMEIKKMTNKTWLKQRPPLRVPPASAAWWAEINRLSLPKRAVRQPPARGKAGKSQPASTRPGPSSSNPATPSQPARPSTHHRPASQPAASKPVPAASAPNGKTNPPLPPRPNQRPNGASPVARTPGQTPSPQTPAPQPSNGKPHINPVNPPHNRPAPSQPAPLQSSTNPPPVYQPPVNKPLDNKPPVGKPPAQPTSGRAQMFPRSADHAPRAPETRPTPPQAAPPPAKPPVTPPPVTPPAQERPHDHASRPARPDGHSQNPTPGARQPASPISIPPTGVPQVKPANGNGSLNGHHNGAIRPNGEARNGVSSAKPAAEKPAAGMPAANMPAAGKPAEQPAAQENQRRTRPPMHTAWTSNTVPLQVPMETSAQPPILRPNGRPLFSRVQLGLDRLLKQNPDLPLETAVLGVCDDGLPVLLDLNDPTPGAVAVISDEREAQLDLLRTAIISMVSRNSPSAVQYLVFSGSPETWTSWTQERKYDRFCLGVVHAEDEQAVREWVLRLADWTEQRRLGLRGGPPVLVVMDTVNFLPKLAYDVRLNFDWMAKEGPIARIWPLATLSTELASALGTRLLRAFQSRILGFANDPAVYTRIAGISETEAACFSQPGEFAIQLGDNWLRFRLLGTA